MNGIVAVLALVLIGMGVTSVYFWKAPPAIERIRALREATDQAAGPARVAAWLEFGQGLIHQRLVQLRLSARQPWLATHVVKVPLGEPEVWGVDLAGLAPEAASQEGLLVVVRLPAAKLLGRGDIRGDMARNVPRYAAGSAVPDASARAKWIVDSALEPLAKALSRDIEGAALEVRIGEDLEEEASR